MFEILWRLDQIILHYLNVQWTHPILDQFWLFVTQLHKQPGVLELALPALLGWLTYIYRAQTLKLLIVFGLAVALSDTIAYRVIKGSIQRQRPFQNPTTASWVRKVGQAHGSSFPSNHAANVFAGATILAWFFPGPAQLFYIFATIVAVSRVALGVHYPSDAIFGVMLGIFVGYLFRAFLLNQSTFFHLRKRVSITGDDSSSWRTRSRRMERR